MTTERIWNITDHPTTDVEARTLMILGRSCLPGRYVQVDSELLKNAHKLQEDVKKHLVFIGAQPPAAYTQSKKPTRAPYPKGSAREHGELPVEAIAAAAPATVEKALHENKGGKRPKKSWEG